MKNLSAYLFLVSMIVACGRAGETSLPTKSAMRRQTLLKIPLATAATVTRIEATLIEFIVPAKAPPHVHPCPVIGQVMEGTIRFQIENQPERILQAGDAFLEPAGVHILHFDNVGPGRARFVAFYLADQNDHELIQLLP